MTVSDETLKELAMLSQGRNPAWTKQADYTAASVIGVPAVGATGGVSVADAVVALLQVEPRLNPATRTVKVEILTAVPADDYNCIITIDGAVDSSNSYTAGGGDTTTDIAVGLAADINLNSTKVVATTDGAVITMVRDDDAMFDDFFHDLSTSSTPANLSTTWQDATYIEMDVYGRASNQTASAEKFEVFPGMEVLAVSRKGFIDRLSVAGFDYAFVHPTSFDGNFSVWIGPCALES